MSGLVNRMTLAVDYMEQAALARGKEVCLDIKSIESAANFDRGDLDSPALLGTIHDMLALRPTVKNIHYDAKAKCYHITALPEGPETPKPLPGRPFI